MLVAYDFPGSADASATEPAPRRRRVLLPTLLILGLLVVSFTLFANFWSDKLWFDSVDKSSVFSTLLLTRLLLFVVFGLIMAVGVWLCLWVAYRSRPAYRGGSPEQISLERYRQSFDPARRPVFVIVPALLGLLGGISASAEWQTFLLWRNAAPFNTTDPQFNYDISFFTFQVPFQRFVLGYLMTVVVLGLLGALVVHYIYGGIKLQSPGERTTPAARAEISLLLGLFLLLKAWSYWLDRFELSVKQGSLITGLTYTDVNAVLPAKDILVWIAVVCALLFFVNVFVRNWTLPLLGFGLLLVSSLVIGGIWPTVVQQFQVRPSEAQKEQPYIQRNIDSTRAAYRIADAKVNDYSASDKPDKAAIAKDSGTLTNVRLIDPSLVSPTFRQLQQIRGYYGFPDSLDIDRYNIDGKQTGSVVAVRELNLDGIPDSQRNWINDHTVYTHGYGMVAAYDNTATSDGQPLFYESNVPPAGKLNIQQPRVYFGEQSPTYSIVGAPAGTSPVELDYPDDNSANGQKNNTYTGTGGVPIGSLFNKLVFAVKLQEQNILLSNLVNDQSRILYNREPRDRVQAVAPWLTLDGDPYPAVVGGRVVWIVDGYTTSDQYPYSQPTTLGEATADSVNTRAQSVAQQGRDQVNYIRNSVKAVVDAYDGTVSLYEWDTQDPVLKAWESAFPGTVLPHDQIPADLEAHFRYPEDVFKVQREMLSKYHVTDPQSFYGGQDFWIVPDDPTRRGANQPQPPYYLTLQMPGATKPSFSLTTTFAPNKRQTLAAFMAVNSEPGPNYGTLQVLQLPRQTTIPGPSQVQNNFESDPAVSAQLSLLRRGGSDVELGNLLSLPVGGGMLYVEPVYVLATGTEGYPLLRKVLVSFGQTVAFEDTLPLALAKVFGTNAATTTPTTPGTGPTPSPTPTPAPTGTPQAQLAVALTEAQSAYDDGQNALKTGDFAAYGVAQKKLAAALARAEALAKEIALGGTSTPSPTPTPSASASASASPATTISQKTA